MSREQLYIADLGDATISCTTTYLLSHAHTIAHNLNHHRSHLNSRNQLPAYSVLFAPGTLEDQAGLRTTCLYYSYYNSSSSTTTTKTMKTSFCAAVGLLAAGVATRPAAVNASPVTAQVGD